MNRKQSTFYPRITVIMAALVLTFRVAAGTYSSVLENDLFAGTDQNYSNGVLIQYVSDPMDNQKAVPWIGELLPKLYRPSDKVWRSSIGLGHAIYTPRDISINPPDPKDRPYSGWLFLSAGLIAETSDRRVDSAQLEVGIVGQGSLGQTVQTNFHNLIDAEYHPKGWSHQLNTEVGGTLRLERLEFGPIVHWGPFDFDRQFSFTGALGTIETSVGLGGSVRTGSGIVRDYGPPRIKPAMAGASFFTPPKFMAWSLFVGAEAKAFARNIFLDGNTFLDSPHVEKKPLVADLQFGATLTYQKFRAAFTFVNRTREFVGQRDATQYGAISMSLQVD